VVHTNRIYCGVYGDGLYVLEMGVGG
jgi:hypothetical protein